MRYRFVLATITFALTALLVSRGSAAESGTPAPAGGAPGEAIEGLECAITSFDSIIVLGSPCAVGISLKNVSQHEIAVPRTAFGAISLTPTGGAPIFERSQLPSSESEPPVLSARDLVRIKPGGVHRLKHTTYLAKDRADSQWTYGPYFLPLAAGEYQMQFSYIAAYSRIDDDAQLGGARPWKGQLTSSPVRVSVVSLSDRETVGRLMAGVQSNTEADSRRLYLWAISFVTCRCYGKNDGGDESIRALESWWKEHQRESRQEWIVASLSSNDPRERGLAAERAIQVTDPRLRTKLLAVLDPKRPDVSDKLFTALWTNFQDREAFDYARKVLNDPSYTRRYEILAIVRDHKIEPLRDDCQAAFISWLKTEKRAEPLRHLVSAAGSYGFEDSIPILEALDRQGGGPFKELILSLGSLEGEAYEPRLIEHLRSGNDEQRHWAAWSLSSYGTVASADALIQALSDPNENVRKHACRALGNLGLRLSANQRAVAKDEMVEMLASDEKVDRYTIHNALVYITGVRPPEGTYSPNRPEAAEAWQGVTARRE